MSGPGREERVLTGWGRTAPSRATVVRPPDVAGIAAELVRRPAEACFLVGSGGATATWLRTAGGWCST